MKALSLWQPWATLWLGPKRYETRSWRTNYRGLVVVHAAKRWSGEQRALALSEPMAGLLEEMGLSARSLPRGAYVGAVGLLSCHPVEQVATSYPERSLGNFAPGRYAWRRGGAVVFPEPIPARGQQGLWSPTQEERQQVLAQIRAAGESAGPPVAAYT